MNLGKIFDIGGGTLDKVVKPLITVVLLVVVYFIVSKAIKNYKQRNVGLSTPGNFNPDTLASRVNDAAESWFNGDGDFDDLCEKLMGLPDAQLKAVNDRYDKLFGKGAKTMYTALDGEFCVLCNYKGPLLKRMQGLGLG